MCRVLIITLLCEPFQLCGFHLQEDLFSSLAEHYNKGCTKVVFLYSSTSASTSLGELNLQLWQDTSV